MSTEISKNYYERAKGLMPGGVNSPVRAFNKVGGTPFFTQRAEGPYLYTEDGQKLIDFVGTWGPAILGHNHPEVRQAIQEALERGTSFGTPNAYEVLLAEAIQDAMPWLERIRMCSSGTEACMSAIRLARGYTGRTKLVKFSGCYHGHSDSLLIKAGSGALTHGCPDSAGVPEALARETLLLPFNDAEALTQIFRTYPTQIAGVILEPYPANCGLLLPKPGYLQHLRDLCTQHGTVLIMDEVMTGFRVALGGAQQREGVYGDLTTLAKIIGGGLPVGAVAGRADIMNKLAPEGPVYQAGTLSGNPLAMAAGLCTLQLLKSENPYPYLEQLGAQIQADIQAQAQKAGLALQVPRIGSMFSIFFSDTSVYSFQDVAQSDHSRFNQFFHHCLDNGVFLPPSPYETAFLSAAHTPELLKQAAHILGSGF